MLAAGMVNLAARGRATIPTLTDMPKAAMVGPLWRMYK